MTTLINKPAGLAERTALIFPPQRYSFAQLQARVVQYKEELASGISPGDVVAILSDYSFDAIALFFALCELKAVLVPITAKVATEVENRLGVARCTREIRIENSRLHVRTRACTEPRYPLIDRLVQQGAAGLILFSSGSTGTPKAMVHNLDRLLAAYGDKHEKRLIFMVFLMFDHIGGLNTLFNCLATGVTMVFPPSRNPEAIAALIERYGVNVLPASPTFLNLLLISGAHEMYDMRSLRMITYGTEPMPDSLLAKLKAAFPRVRFLQTFGTSETGISRTTGRSSAGTLLRFDDPATEHKIVDGELWLRSKTQIMGYLNSSMDRFTADGWFRTGDLVETAEDGFIKIVGRSRELINVGGEKVLPSEVESVLFQMPGVLDCTVCAEPNPITGSMVVAKILFDTPLKPSEAKHRVTDFCRNRLARYKIPAKVILQQHSEISDRFKKKRL